jgi:hypothetical protein
MLEIFKNLLRRTSKLWRQVKVTWLNRMHQKINDTKKLIRKILSVEVKKMHQQEITLRSLRQKHRIPNLKRMSHS